MLPLTKELCWQMELPHHDLTQWEKCVKWGKICTCIFLRTRYTLQYRLVQTCYFVLFWASFLDENRSTKMDAIVIREAVVKASVSCSKRLQFAVQVWTLFVPVFYECPHVFKRDDNIIAWRLLFYPFKITLNWRKLVLPKHRWQTHL
jgi:hypothetical protein